MAHCIYLLVKSWSVSPRPTAGQINACELPAILNRFKTELKLGSCRNLGLQEEWAQIGPEAFEDEKSNMISYFYMLQENKPAMKYIVPLLWMMTGFISWYLSIYLFSYLLSPALIDVVRKANAVTQSIFMKDIANLLYTKVADFTLCFIFAMLISFFTKSTKLRLLLFILGAIAISGYIQVERLINYMGAYSELPSWAIRREFQGFIAIFLIIPLLSYAGSQIGNYLRSRRMSS